MFGNKIDTKQTPFSVIVYWKSEQRSLVLALSDISFNDYVLFELYGLFCSFMFSMIKMTK